MNLLVLPSQFPYPGYPFCGIFNERSVGILSKLCDRIEVLAPRPFVPPFFSFLNPRWNAYKTAKGFENRNGISVYRPMYPEIPWLGGALSVNQGGFYFSRGMAKGMHRRCRFDAILSFDLVGTGLMSWRIGKYLDIPSAGWVTGRFPKTTSWRKEITRALHNLDVVFYQSIECLEEAASLLEIAKSKLSQEKHIVLARGILEPPQVLTTEVRQRIRLKWGITDGEVLVLNIGRVCRDKGIYDLIEAISLANAKDPRIKGVVLGSLPDFDETKQIIKFLKSNFGNLNNNLQILPACTPEKVWDFLCAADIFAFSSHHDGMPNSLLEAMAIGIPTIGFAIPPVVEVEAGRGGLVLVPPFNIQLFAEEILRLVNSPQERIRISKIGKAEVLHRFMMHENMAKAFQFLSSMKNIFLDRNIKPTSPPT